MHIPLYALLWCVCVRVCRHVVLVEAEAGLGKSRLCQEIVTRTERRGVRILLGAGVDTETNTMFFVWKSIFSQARSLITPY